MDTALTVSITLSCIIFSCMCSISCRSRVVQEPRHSDPLTPSPNYPPPSNLPLGSLSPLPPPSTTFALRACVVDCECSLKGLWGETRCGLRTTDPGCARGQRTNMYIPESGRMTDQTVIAVQQYMRISCKKYFS